STAVASTSPLKPLDSRKRLSILRNCSLTAVFLLLECPVMKRMLLPHILFAVLTMAACGGGVVYYANVPPPPLRAEAFGVATGPGYVWINGYWGWSGGAHVWVAGRWALPPRPHAVWVAPYWERQGARY